MSDSKRDTAARHRAAIRLLQGNRMSTKRLRELLAEKGFVISDATWRRDLTEMQLDETMLVCRGETVTTRGYPLLSSVGRPKA